MDPRRFLSCLSLVAFILITGFAVSCGGGGSSHPTQAVVEERLGIDGVYTVKFTIGTCATKVFNLTIGSDQSKTTDWGGDLSECYLFVPVSGKTVTYTFTSDGDTTKRTISVSGNNVIMDEVWDEESGNKYTGHFTLFFAEDLKSFQISGVVTEENDEECDGYVTGTGTRIDVSSVAAYSLDDLNGTWFGNGILMPAKNFIGTTKFGYDVDSLEVSNGSAVISAISTSDEDSDGADTISLSITSNGTLSSGDPKDYLFMNAGKDVLPTLYINNVSGEQEIGLYLKKPASCTISDLNGTWHGVGILTPQKIKVVQDSFDFDVSTMEISNNTATISADPTSGNIFDTLTLSLSLANNGSISINDPDKFMFINAGKDVLCSFWKDPETQEQGMDIWVKKAASYALTDLDGTWYGVGIMTPSAGDFTMNTDNVGYNVERVEISNGTATVSTISSSDSTSGYTQTLSITDQGKVLTGDPNDFNFLNAGKDVLCHLFRDLGSGVQILEIYVKQKK